MIETIIVNPKETQGILCIHLKGYIVSYNSAKFLNSISAVIKQTSKKKIVIDFKEVSYIASVGVGTLFEVLKLQPETCVTIYFMHISNKIYEIMSLLGLVPMVPVIKDFKEIFG